MSERLDKVELMIVTDSFMIESIGLVLVPSFELPAEGKWENISEKVTIKTPNGDEILVDAFFSVAHMNIKDISVSASKRWPVLVSLRGVKKESVPIGSVVYVSKSTKKAIFGQNA